MIGHHQYFDLSEIYHIRLIIRFVHTRSIQRVPHVKQGLLTLPVLMIEFEYPFGILHLVFLIKYLYDLAIYRFIGLFCTVSVGIQFKDGIVPKNKKTLYIYFIIDQFRKIERPFTFIISGPLITCAVLVLLID